MDTSITITITTSSPAKAANLLIMLETFGQELDIKSVGDLNLPLKVPEPIKPEPVKTEPAIKTDKAGAGEKPVKEFNFRTAAVKKCIECGCSFEPHSNRQMKCDPCREKKTVKTPIEPIEDTIAEIERKQKERENAPYEFITGPRFSSVKAVEQVITGRRTKTLDMNL